jgi:hypothetical protein
MEVASAKVTAAFIFHLVKSVCPALPAKQWVSGDLRFFKKYELTRDCALWNPPALRGGYGKCGNFARTDSFL